MYKYLLRFLRFSLVSLESKSAIWYNKKCREQVFMELYMWIDRYILFMLKSAKTRARALKKAFLQNNIFLQCINIFLILYISYINNKLTVWIMFLLLYCQKTLLSCPLNFIQINYKYMYIQDNVYNILYI